MSIYIISILGAPNCFGAPNSAASAKGVLERRIIKMTLQDLAGEDDANHDVFLKVCQWSNL